MNLFYLISSTVVLSTLSVAGFCESQMTDLESRVSGLEKTHSISVDSHLSHQGNGYENTYQSGQPGGSSMNYTGAGSKMYPKTVLDAAHTCHSGTGVYFGMEFLWLRAIEDEIGYALKTTFVNGRRSFEPREPNFEFDPGFRVVLGYNLPYDGWDISTTYTWHYTYAHDSVSTSIKGIPTIGGTQVALPINDSSLAFIRYQSGRASWQNQFNAWDLDLGRNFYVGQRLAIKPTWGLKAALIRQHFQTFMNDAELPRGSEDSLNIGWNDISGRFKSRFWGIGPKVGVSGEWELGAGFSLVGNVHTALLYGEFTTYSNISAIIVADREAFADAPVGSDDGGVFNDSFYRLRPMMHANLALSWSRCFWDWMAFSMHLGWEAQYWWEQMEFISFKDITPNGDLSLTGLNAGLRFDF